MSQRINFISGKLFGVRYQADTLIGGPKQPERFVVRDDAFDCVTFCEVVLAGAIARDFVEFETLLRRIRYDRGNVQYDQRNHYFADWCKRNIENGICKPVAIEPSVVIDKTVTCTREFGRHPVSIVAVSKQTLLQNAGFWRRATSSASHRDAPISISFTPASWRSARVASCCCAMHRKAAAGSSWTTDDDIRHRQSVTT